MNIFKRIFGRSEKPKPEVVEPKIVVGIEPEISQPEIEAEKNVEPVEALQPEEILESELELESESEEEQDDEPEVEELKNEEEEDNTESETEVDEHESEVDESTSENTEMSELHSKINTFNNAVTQRAWKRKDDLVDYAKTMIDENIIVKTGLNMNEVYFEIEGIRVPQNGMIFIR